MNIKKLAVACNRQGLISGRYEAAPGVDLSRKVYNFSAFAGKRFKSFFGPEPSSGVVSRFGV